MKPLMETLVNKLGIGEDGGSNLDVSSEGRSWDRDEPERESKKEHGNEQPNWSVMDHSQFFFKREEKVYLKPYQGEINAFNLNE